MMVEIVALDRIWDRAPHNAFTDLLRRDDEWLCCCREAETHSVGPSAIRVLRSVDGRRWSSAAEVVEAGVDLRDPKLSICPDGRLMLLMGASLYDRDGTYRTRSPRVAFSGDGTQWTTPARCLAEDHWLWRVTWHGKTGYSVSKLGEGAHPRRGFLYRTCDGLDWEFITELLLPDDTWTASETTLRLRDDGEMIALIRPDWIGASHPPYVDWSFTRIDHSLGGPNFIILPDGAMWASARGRGDDGKPVTALARMTRDSYEPVINLPSGGDCSYPGMVWWDGLLWMTYYSSHEGRSSIYRAIVRLDGHSAGATAQS